MWANVCIAMPLVLCGVKGTLWRAPNEDVDQPPHSGGCVSLRRVRWDAKGALWCQWCFVVPMTFGTPRVLCGVNLCFAVPMVFVVLKVLCEA